MTAIVSVRCMTYNQSEYIEDALNGFTMQQTDFPFVCCIVDDASTDGEQEVIRKYMLDNFRINDQNVAKMSETDDFLMSFAQHKENINCFFAVYYLKYNHYKDPQLRQRKLNYISEWEDGVKYISFCEGDDYWNNKMKLQKQINILESSNSVCIYSNFDCVDVKGNVVYSDKLTRQRDLFRSGWVFFQMSKSNFIQTLTVVLRKSSLNDFYKYYDRPYDFPLFLHLSGKGELIYLNEITGCYRINPKGAMASGMLSFDKGGKHTISNALMAFFNDAYSKVPLKQKYLFLCLSIYRFHYLDNKRIVLKHLANHFVYKIMDRRRKSALKNIAFILT